MFKPSRRDLLTLGGAAVAVGVTRMPAWAASHTSLGAARIDVLSDGHLTLPGSFLFEGLPENELAAILARYDLAADDVQPPCNLTLYRDGERTVLFDVGSGSNFMPSAGKVQGALDALDVDVSEVTDVVFTHAHPDHLWGVLDDFDDPLFSEATYHIGKTEWDYWMDPATVDTIGDARQAFAAGAMRNLKAIEDGVVRFDAGAEILPGIAARATYGHTPGHTSFEIRSGSQSALVVGDAIGNHHIAFERPEWEVNSDQDESQGAATRKALLDQLANEKMKLIGYHLPYPGIGFAEAKDGAYRFVPAT